MTCKNHCLHKVENTLSKVRHDKDWCNRNPESKYHFLGRNGGAILLAYKEECCHCNHFTFTIQEHRFQKHYMDLPDITEQPLWKSGEMKLTLPAVVTYLSELHKDKVSTTPPATLDYISKHQHRYK